MQGPVTGRRIDAVMTSKAVIGVILVAVVGLALAYAVGTQAMSEHKSAVHAYLQDDATAAATTIAQSVKAGITPSMSTWTYNDARIGSVSLKQTVSSSGVTVTATALGMTASQSVPVQ